MQMQISSFECNYTKDITLHSHVLFFYSAALHGTEFGFSEVKIGLKKFQLC
jgi:hypothetical protein